MGSVRSTEVVAKEAQVRQPWREEERREVRPQRSTTVSGLHDVEFTDTWRNRERILIDQLAVRIQDLDKAVYVRFRGQREMLEEVSAASLRPPAVNE